MSARAVHSEDALLDAVRAVVADRGVRAATVAAVRDASGASIGSIYHRFASVDDLLVRAWIRAARRSQDAALAALKPDPRESVVSAALAMFDFCVDSPDDAVLLSTFRRADFVDTELPGSTRQELERLNDPIVEPMRSLARSLFGRGGQPSLDLLLIVLVDLPPAFAQRCVVSTAHIRPYRRRLEAAVRAIVYQR
jgi:AcrR family transcriptional regulator